MFAAAATLAQMALDISIATAKFIATKVLLLALLGVFLPFITKGLMIWGFEYLIEYGRVIGAYMVSSISDMTGENYDVSIHLSGVGGYLAQQTGLIDYCAIIITGWGLYWVVAVLSKTTKII